MARAESPERGAGGRFQRICHSAASGQSQCIHDASHAKRRGIARSGAPPRPIAAPVRFRVFAAPAHPREIFGRPLARSLGAPAFSVAIGKCLDNPSRKLILEWNEDEQCFHERRSEDHFALVTASSHGQDRATALRPVLAFESGKRAGQAEQPPLAISYDDRNARRARTTRHEGS